MAGRLPEPLAAIVSAHAARQTALVDAAVSARWDTLFELFRTDPLVVPLGTDTARRMFVEMVEATARHLPAELMQEVA